MLLSQILFPNEILSRGFSDLTFEKPCDSVEKLQKNDVFFSKNSTSYITKAIQRGACAIVTDGDFCPSSLSVPLLWVKNVRQQYALAWQRYTGHPETKLRLIAVTGTNGKTSVSHFLASLLRSAGHTVGLIGTVTYSDGKHERPSPYTTPPPDLLYPLLREMTQNGTEFAVMEASSHAIAQERLFGLHFESAIFTNLTRDHLDYHKTEEAYRNTKASLFRHAERSILNLDDPSARHMAFASAGDVYYYAQCEQAEFEILSPSCSEHDLRYLLRIGSESLPLQVPLTGEFHVYNTAAAVCAAYLAGVPCAELIKAAAQLTPPTGRLEKLATDTEYQIYIDYAHTPDALQKALSALRPYTKRLTVVFGAGGNRDRGKREEMGKVANDLADRIILTKDNPRNESQDQIEADLLRGIRKTQTISIPNRKEAIEYAMETALADEIILLAGKGHENYLIDQNGKHPFSEREIVCKYLERKGQENVSQHE